MEDLTAPSGFGLTRIPWLSIPGSVPGSEGGYRVFLQTRTMRTSSSQRYVFPSGEGANEYFDFVYGGTRS